MRCIFCKEDSSSSISVEHIVPESLGNTQHMLPRGVVCDKCNNYFARKIEAPLLNSIYFKEQRFKMAIASKKNKIPFISGVHLESLTKIEMHKQIKSNDTSVMCAMGEADESPFIHSVLNQKSGRLVFPVSSYPLEDYVLSRFIAKVGLEVLASNFLKIPGGVDEITDKAELDELREYVRQGTPERVWPYSSRPIYSPEFLFVKNGETFEVLHEFKVIITDISELYIVLAIFGMEYALNLGGRTLGGYYKWLKDNNERSPLYI
ncbi:MAG: HNH endonuclease [Deltaproteobacteria bacterium]|nr:HNH endonuclease [Deltaproteobacteria bacterium]